MRAKNHFLSLKLQSDWLRLINLTDLLHSTSFPKIFTNYRRVRYHGKSRSLKVQRKGQTRSLTVEDMRRSLAGPATAVGAALEQVRWLGGVITVGVSVAVLDAPGSRPGRLRLRWTRARPDRVHSLKEPATVATPCSAARLQHAQLIVQHYQQAWLLCACFSYLPLSCSHYFVLLRFCIFLPARRYASAGYRDRNVSVRPSVTRRYCVKTKKASGMISSPSGSPKTLVF